MPPSHSDQDRIPPFDGTPIKASLFLRDIGEHAARHGYLSLLLQGYWVSRNLLIVASSDVIPQVRNFYTDAVNNPLPSRVGYSKPARPTTAHY